MGQNISCWEQRTEECNRAERRGAELLRDMKTCKVRSPGSSKRYGIAAQNLQQLLEKSCRKFEFEPVDAYICAAEDGTIIEEANFADLKQNTELVIMRKESQGVGVTFHLEQLLDQMDENNNNKLMEAMRGMLTDDMAPKRRKLLQGFIQSLDENIEADECVKDGKWFEGLDERFKSKSQYMKHNCSCRIRGYLTEVKKYASKMDTKTHQQFINTVKEMENMLREVKFNGHYFNRRENQKERLCDDKGWFQCQGAFDMDSCSSKHSINPYANKESRIVFSTWNLDHRIEKKRTILPALASAIKKCKTREINFKYFYSLLFTLDNLKLVQIACHKKTNHKLSCDRSKFYRKRKR
uniref:Caspase-activated deoxyribonuclease n=1 Tax=Callorhinchus milii TaxID=7868 RepID=V9KVC4_CALMI